MLNISIWHLWGLLLMVMSTIVKWFICCFFDMTHLILVSYNSFNGDTKEPEGCVTLVLHM